ncbi:ATPase [Artemisia annua]|uniref:ATPase n=1 Tax=Artemisia annua TaxID=35608 RepID=A0A2U1LY52_ARTAN|nr:ATPase [Artemisia annua]
MPNRGVEIFLTNCENELKEVKRFLVLSNIPGEHLVDAMAKAHLFAKRSGSQHNACISNLELGRWVQLFQQLLTSGNQALWSLNFSFECTYLSSLGANEGKDIINEAIGSYLSINLKSCSDSSLCLPGGHILDETSVRQNCMYLEFLGAQVASHSSRIALGSCPMEFVQCQSNSMRTYVTDLGMLHDMNLISQPMLSLDLANLTGNQHLINAVKCVGLIRLSHQQWHAETGLKYSDKTRCFIPVLESLRTLERRILAMLVESPVFDDDMKNLERSLSWSLNSQRSLLWAYGGYPFSPSSVEIYRKQQQLLNLFTETSLQEQGTSL